MKQKKSYFRRIALLSGILLAGTLMVLLASNSVAGEQNQYASLKNGVELQNEATTVSLDIRDISDPDQSHGSLKCGDEADTTGSGDKKCGDGDDKKCGDGGEDKKCGEGKCGGDEDKKE
jgi:hypothetical protein